MAASKLKDGEWTMTRERVWGQYRSAHDRNVLVRLPSDPQSKQRYERKGFTFIRYGGEEMPIATLDIPQVIVQVAPKVEAVVEPIVSEPAAPVESLPAAGAEEPELYVAEHPYKSKRKKSKTRRSKE